MRYSGSFGVRTARGLLRAGLTMVNALARIVGGCLAAAVVLAVAGARLLRFTINGKG